MKRRFAPLLLLLLAPGSLSGQAERADEFLIVDCRLPGQVRQLGTRVTYVSARRAAKLSASDCGLRGGEFVRQDRASRGAALDTWLPAALEGDVEAQINVGTIYERGFDQPPDFERAVYWYRQAAERDSVRAQLKLAELYEAGLGVPLDLQQALEWYQRAIGGRQPIVLTGERRPVPDLSPEVRKLSEQIEGMAQENLTLEAELRAALTSLDAARRIGAAQREELQSRIDELTGTLESRRRTVAALEEQLRRTEAALGEAKNEAIRAGNSAREQTMAQIEAQTALLEQTLAIDELSERLALREASLAEAKARADALVVRVAELEDRAEELAARKTVQTLAAERSVMAPPTVTLIDPTLTSTRGLVKVTVTSEVPRRVVARVTASAGLLSVSLNGAVVIPNEHGVIVSNLPAVSGSRTITIVAVDHMGQRGELSFDLGSPSPLAGGSSSPGVSWHGWDDLQFGRYHALVIGNNRYRSLPRLQTAVADAMAVADVLEQRYGFQVTRLIDADRYAILSALNELRESLGGDDNLVIYYAGHGELDEVNMRGHWLPVDAEAGSTANWISNVAITDILNAMQVRHVLLLADSCYSGALTRSGLTDLRAGMTPAEERHWIQTMLKRRTRLALTSGGLSPVLDAGGGAHSVFADALLEVLRSNEDLLGGRELYERVAARVAFRASNLSFEQVPEFAPIRHAGHEAGEFFLLPGAI